MPQPISLPMATTDAWPLFQAAGVEMAQHEQPWRGWFWRVNGLIDWNGVSLGPILYQRDAAKGYHHFEAIGYQGLRSKRVPPIP